MNPYDIDTDVTFIALPSVSQLSNSVRGDKDRSKLARYKGAQWAIKRAQEQAAVIAAEILRPDLVESAKYKRMEAIRQAKQEYADACLKVFSEKCTKGL